MIIFHEGLPGSGKSYEALVRRIIPALEKGRPVDAYVEGLNHEKIASLAKISEERCRELLIALTREQAPAINEHARPNALIVLDEAQNFWGNRAKLSPAMTEFITEHRHQGQDIVLMGQDVRDVNAIWRRRVELKLSFLKLSGFGTSTRYSVTTYRHLGGDQYSRVGLETHKYDKQFFGTYASHVSDQTNTSDYSDSRALVWNHWGFKYLAPALIAASIWGCFKIYYFFKPPAPIAGPAATTTSAPTGGPASYSGPPITSAPAASQAAAPVKDERPPIERHLAGLTDENRIRLGGLINSDKHQNGIIEWVKGGTVVTERLSLDQLRRLGVAVLISGESVQLAIGNFTALATPWPLEDSGRVSHARQELIRGPQPLSTAQELPPGLGSLGGQRAIELPGELRSSR